MTRGSTGTAPTLVPGAQRDEAISRLRVPALGELTPEVRTFLDGVVERRGRVPNPIRAQTLLRDSVVRSADLVGSLLAPETSELSQGERELIGVVVSAANGCVACLLTHVQALAGIIEDPVHAMRIGLGYRHVRLSDRERAIADFAEQLTLSPGQVEDDHLTPLREAGLSDEGLLEVVSITAAFNYLNRLSSGMGIVPEDALFA